MANHVHKQIRDAVKTALTGLTTTGERVFANRVHPLSAAELPAIRLFVEGEEAENVGLTLNNKVYQRSLMLSIEACAKATSALDDTLDQISKEIEIALSSGVSLGGRNHVPVYAGMAIDFEDLDQPVGLKRHRYRLIFTAASSSPDAFI